MGTATVWAAGEVVAWGYNWDGQCDVPPGNDFTAVAGGGSHSLALRSNGSLAAWGFNDYGQCDVPPGNDFTAIAGGYYHSLALRSDGSLAAWGDNGDGQCDVPTGNDFTAVAGGGSHSLALRSDGSLAAWGLNNEGQCDVPSGNDFTAVATGGNRGLALRSDGSLAAWGYNSDVLPGNDFTAVAAGEWHSLALADFHAPALTWFFELSRVHSNVSLPNLYSGYAELQVWPPEGKTFATCRVQSPDATWMNLEIDPDGGRAWIVHETDLPALEAMLPDGPYQILATYVEGGSTTELGTKTPGAYPAYVDVTWPTDNADVGPTPTIQWVGSSVIWVCVYDPVADVDVLDVGPDVVGGAESYTVPPGVLQGGRTYWLYVDTSTGPTTHRGSITVVPFTVSVSDPLTVSAQLDVDWVYQNTPLTTQDRHMATLTISVDADPNGNSQYTTLVTKLSGPGDVTCQATGDPLVWEIVGSRRGEGSTGEVTLEVLVTGLDVGGEGSTTRILTVRLLGDVDGNGAPEPGDVQLLINKLNGIPTPGYDDRAFDLDANGGAEPGDVQVLMNILNGLPVP